MSIREKLARKGFNRDVEVDEEKWRKLKEEEHSDSRTLAFLERLDEPTYRDNREKDSIELKDYRERKYDANFVAELEHFNPDRRPLSHLFVDFPLWLWRNRIKNRGPER